MWRRHPGRRYILGEESERSRYGPLNYRPFLACIPDCEGEGIMYVVGVADGEG